MCLPSTSPPRCAIVMTSKHYITSWVFKLGGIHLKVIPEHGDSRLLRNVRIHLPNKKAWLHIYLEFQVVSFYIKQLLIFHVSSRDVFCDELSPCMKLCCINCIGYIDYE
jgi:hypothetical protein